VSMRWCLMASGGFARPRFTSRSFIGSCCAVM
jgi:hypothetical protein